MSEVFREIEEDLRLERYRALAVRYWRPAAAAAVLLVGAIGGSLVLAEIRDNRRESEGERYAAALAKLATGRPAEAALDLTELADTAEEGYRVLAELAQGAARARSGDLNGGWRAFRRIAQDSDLPAHFRGFASVQMAMLLLDYEQEVDYYGESGYIRAQIRELFEGDGPWRHLAREVDAHLAYRDSDFELARSRFRGLAGDPEAPPGVRARAREMLNLWADPEP